MAMRRLRGLVVTGLIWGLLWLGPGLILGTYAALTAQSDMPIRPQTRVEILGIWCMEWSLWGAASGVVFGLSLIVLQVGKVVTTLSTGRFLISGALGAAVPPAVFLALVWAREPFPDPMGPTAIVLAIAAALGALSAGVVLWLAKRAPAEPIGAA